MEGKELGASFELEEQSKEKKTRKRHVGDYSEGNTD